MDSMDLFRWDGSSGRAGGRVGRFFFRVLHRVYDSPGYTFYPAALRAQGQVVAAGDDVVVLDGNTGDLIRISPEARVRVALPAPEPVAITEDHRRHHEEEWVGTVAEEWRPRLRRAVAGMTYPEHLPVASTLMGGGDGSIWVRSFRAWPAEVELWWWLPSPGVPPRRVAFPANFTPLDAVGPRVLGVATDELDVEYAVVRLVQELPGPRSPSGPEGELPCPAGR